MKTIHIVDAGKASLVMSSEVFKDKIPGSVVIVSTTGKHALEVLQGRQGATAPDMCVVDFDLPDTDGVTLVREIRRVYSGPILLTAYPDPVVEQAVASDLFHYNDAGGWIKKPVRFEELEQKIDRFLTDQHRLGKRFDTDFKTKLVGKGAGRGKRAPKVEGRIVNMSLGGACVALSGNLKVRLGEEMTISVALPAEAAPQNVSGKSASRQTVKAKKGVETKIKATIAWLKDGGKLAGLQFGKMTDVHRRSLERLLKGLT